MYFHFDSLVVQGSLCIFDFYLLVFSKYFMYFLLFPLSLLQVPCGPKVLMYFYLLPLSHYQVPYGQNKWS